MNSKRFISLFVALLMAAVMLTGCAAHNDTNANTQTQAPDMTTAPIDEHKDGDPGVAPAVRVSYINQSGEAVPMTVYSANALEAQLIEYDTRFTDSSSEFAVKMNEAIAAKEDWTGVYSPLSLQIVLQMLANGGDSETSRELFKAVCGDLTRDEVNSNTAKLLSIFNTVRGLSVNSAVIVNDDYRVRQDFADLVGSYYRAAVGTVDMKDARAAEQQINGWISENTNGLINDMISGLSYDTAMLLLNTLSIEFEWKDPCVAMRDLWDFEGVNGTKRVTMMRHSGESAYGCFDEGEMVILPYKNADYAMAVIMPAAGYTPAKAVSALYSRWNECKQMNGTLNMPKIKLSTDFDVMELVADMGLAEAVGGNFGNLFEFDGDASVSEILQGAVIDVNEYGTTAAAASAAIINRSAPIEEAFTLTCDSPYAMVIYNIQTGMVLFVSIVNDVA